MSKDDIETTTMNVMFDGSEEEDDDEELKTEKIVRYFEDDYYWTNYNRRNYTSR